MQSGSTSVQVDISAKHPYRLWLDLCTSIGQTLLRLGIFLVVIPQSHIRKIREKKSYKVGD
jgi:hypothetical protein